MVASELAIVVVGGTVASGPLLLSSGDGGGDDDEVAPPTTACSHLTALVFRLLAREDEGDFEEAAAAAAAFDLVVLVLTTTAAAAACLCLWKGFLELTWLSSTSSPPAPLAAATFRGAGTDLTLLCCFPPPLAAVLRFSTAMGLPRDWVCLRALIWLSLSPWVRTTDFAVAEFGSALLPDLMLALFSSSSCRLADTLWEADGGESTRGGRLLPLFSSSSSPPLSFSSPTAESWMVIFSTLLTILV